MTRSLFVARAGALLVLGTSVLAASAEDPQPPVSSTVNQLEEIIVTARKKSEQVQDVPGGVSVFTADALEKANATTVDELAKLTTGFTFDPDFGRQADRPVIRGQANILGDNGVSYFVDGVYYNVGTILDFDFGDISSIEIIKGPQSALYGRNTYAGAIAVTTRAPTGDWTGSAKADIAQFGQEKISLATSGPVIKDVLGVAVSGSFYNRSGVTGDLWRNQYTGQKEGKERSDSLNFATYWTPNDRFELRTRVNYAVQEDGEPALFLQGYKKNNVYIDNGNQRTPYFDPSFNVLGFGPGSTYLGAGRYYEGAIQAQGISIDSNRSLGVKPEVTDHRLLTAVTANYSFTDRLTGTYLAAYNSSRFHSAYDFDLQPTSYAPFLDSGIGLSPLPGSPGVYQYAVTPFAPAANYSDDETDRSREVSQELRLRFKNDSLDLLLGGFFYKQHTDSYTLQPPVAGWGSQLVQSLGILQGRMQNACNTFFQNRPGFANCTSIVRVDPFFGTPVPFTSTDGGPSGFPLWTTFGDYSTHGATRNIAEFGSVGFKPTRQLELTGEIRFAQEIQEVLPGHQNDLAYLTDLTRYSSFDSTVAVPYQKAEFHAVTPRFTARYDLTPQSHLYAVLAKGTKPGGINGPNAAAVGYGDYREETNHSYELGSKNILLDNHLLVNVDVFQNNIADYQLTDSIVYQDGTPSTAVKNIGKVRIRGLELEIAYALQSIHGLTARFNGTYLDPKIREGQDLNQGLLADVAASGGANCSLGINPTYAATVAAIQTAAGVPASTVICYSGTGTYFGRYGSIAGQTLPRVPKISLNAALEYAHRLEGDWTFNANANVSYESRKFVEVDNLAWYGQATILNGNIGVSSSRYAFRFWGKNLTNNDSVAAASRFVDATNQSLRGFFGTNRLPRQFGLTASVQF